MVPLGLARFNSTGGKKAKNMFVFLPPRLTSSGGAYRFELWRADNFYLNWSKCITECDDCNSYSTAF